MSSRNGKILFAPLTTVGKDRPTPSVTSRFFVVKAGDEAHPAGSPLLSAHALVSITSTRADAGIPTVTAAGVEAPR